MIKSKILIGSFQYLAILFFYFLLVSALFYAGVYFISNSADPFAGLGNIALIIPMMFWMVPSILIPLIPLYFIFRKIGYSQIASLVSLLSYAMIFTVILLFLVR